MPNIKTIATSLLMISLLGCSSSKFFSKNNEVKSEPKKLVSTSEIKSLFYKDGQEAYYLTCEGPSWTECIQHAGEACLNKGYEVLEKNTVKIPHVFTSDKIQNEMYITCKVVDDLPKK